MNPQADLFVSRPTSKRAAINKRPTASAQRERVYRYLAECGSYGATREEIQEALGLSGDSVRPRVKELLGWGQRPQRLAVIPGVTRVTRSGQRAEVLVIV